MTIAIMEAQQRTETAVDAILKREGGGATLADAVQVLTGRKDIPPVLDRERALELLFTKLVEVAREARESNTREKRDRARLDIASVVEFLEQIARGKRGMKQTR